MEILLTAALLLLLVLCCGSLRQCEESFAACLIKTLEFDIPDTSSTIGFETFRLKNLKCNQGEIGGLESSYVFPLGLNGALSDVKLHCDGIYSYGALGGRVYAAISISSLAIDTSIATSPTSQYPVELSSLSCSLSAFAIKLSFTGGITGSVLNLISPLVESIIKDNVKSMACSKLSQFVSVDGTNMLVERLDPMIKRLIELGQPDSEGPGDNMTTAGYVHWGDSIVSTANRFIFDDYSGHIGQCFFGDTDESQILRTETTTTKFNPPPVPMDSIISYYTHGTGKFSMLLSDKAILPVPSPVTPNSVIQFTEVSVAGLESATVLDIIRPSLHSNISLSNSLYVDHLEIKLFFSFCSDINNIQVCDNKNSSVIAKLSNVTVDMNCSVGAVQSILNTLTLDELTSIPFWMSTVDFFNITSLSVNSTVDSIVIRGANTDDQSFRGGKLTSDLDSGISYLMDNALKLFVSDYTDLVDSVISAAVQGPVRHTVNLAIIEMLKKHKQINRQLEYIKEDINDIGKQGDKLVINWADFPPLVLFRDVASTVTADDLNHFIECLVNKGLSGSDEVTARGIQATQHTRSQINHRHQVDNMPARSTSEHDYQVQDGVLRVSGLDSLFDVTVLAPFPANGPKPHNILTSAGMGTCNNDICRPLDFHYAQPSKKFNGNVRDNGDFDSVSVSLENLDFQLEVLAELTMGAYRSLQVSQLGKPGCLFSVFQKLAIENLALEISQAKVNIGMGYSVDMENANDLEASDPKTLDLTKSVQKLFKMLGQQGTIDQINNVMTQYSKYSKDICVGKDSSGPQGTAHRISSKVEGGEHNDWTASMSIIGTCVVSSLLFLLLVARYYKGRIEEPRVSDISYSLMHSTFADSDVEMRSKEETGSSQSALDRTVNGRICRAITRNTNSPLCLQTELSLLMRLFIPLAILGNIALFVYSNCCMNAVAVLITLSSGVFKSVPVPVLAFGLLGTIVSMWEAKVYLLAILVAFLSGLWPYIKLLCLLYCWVIPPPLPTGIILSEQKSFPFYGLELHPQHRYRVLRAVEILGKWGLLDFYVMVLMMCAFHLNLQVTQPEGSALFGPILIEVLVQPNFGFFSFLLATMASHALSHMVLACHRHVVSIVPVNFDFSSTTSEDVDTLTPTTDSIATRKNCHLFDIKFLVPHHCFPQKDKVKDALQGNFSHLSDDSHLEDDLLQPINIDPPSSHSVIQLTLLGERAIIGHIIMFMIVIIVATSMFSFSFEFKGLVGWILEKQGQGKNIVKYSFDSVGSRMQEAAGLVKNSGPGPVPNVPGLKTQIICMQMCYFAFGLVAPLLQLSIILYIWLVPLSLPHLASAQLIADTVGAWTALDVFCLSIAAALLEIRQFASFIVGDHCGDIDSIASYFIPPQGGQEMKCFDVVTSLSMVSL